jgi:hypothetical protein
MISRDLLVNGLLIDPMRYNLFSDSPLKLTADI